MDVLLVIVVMEGARLVKTSMVVGLVEDANNAKVEMVVVRVKLIVLVVIVVEVVILVWEVV